MVSENDIMPGTGEPVKILNPLSDDMKVMRTNVLPSLIKVYVHNRNRQQPDVQIFEVGRAFVKDPESQTGSSEWWDLTILLAGKIFPEQWGLASKNMDIYYAKGLVEDIAWQLRAGEVTYKQSGYSWFDDIQLDIFFSGNKVGYVGRISPRISEKYDVKQDLFGIVMSVEGLRKVETKLPQYKHISKYPLVRKDVSFIISDEVKAEDIRGFIAKSGSEILRSVEMFDLYQGKHLGANEKSIAFKLIFQSDERTLKEKEVLDQFEKIITLVQNKYNARLRSR
jgi:phenylalanyl-tRNA synthetase beta chain